MIGKNMELMLPQLEKYLFPQPNTGSVNIAQTQTEAKNDATPAKNRCFEGEQRIYQFDSQLLKGSTKFGVYLSPAALEGKPCSTLFYLAGLTCTEETFAIKAHAQHMAAQLSLILITLILHLVVNKLQ